MPLLATQGQCSISIPPESAFCFRGYTKETLVSKLGQQSKGFEKSFPANIYLFKVNNRNTRKRCEICLKLTIITQERCQWHWRWKWRTYFTHRVFLLLTLNKLMLARLEFKKYFRWRQMTDNHLRNIFSPKETTFFTELTVAVRLSYRLINNCRPSLHWLFFTSPKVPWKVYKLTFWKKHRKSLQ